MSLFSRTLLSVLVTFTALSLFCSPAHANSQTFFGPETITIQRLHIHVSQHLFNADSPGDAVLVVHKNTPTKHILGGFVLLNGTLIPLGDFFRDDETVFEKTVRVQSRNYVAITFLGDNGASITVEIKRKTTAPPQITFSANPLSIGEGETSILSWATRYADSVTIDNGVGAVPLSGSQSVSPSATTTYTLTAVGQGGTATASVTVSVYNRPPVANPQSVATDEDTPVSITLTGSDPDEDELSYRIITQPTHGSLSGSLPDLVYTPNENYSGVDAFSFVVNDGDVDSSPATVTIQVNPMDDVPVANPQTITTDEDVPVSITLTGSDPDDDPLTFRVLTDPAHGTLSGTPPNVTYTPSPNYNGSDSFAFAVNDGDTDSSPAIVTIQVNAMPDRPVAQPLLVAATEDTPVSITLAGNDGDNDSLSFAVVSNPSHGALSGTAPLLTYVPDNNYNGSDSFTFIVNDGTQDSEPATVTIQIASVNDAPIGANDTATTTSGSAVTTTNLLAKAADVDGDALSVTDFGQGANGTVIYNGDGTFTYKPRPTFTGTDSFTCTISDGHGGTTTSTITVTVTSAEPNPPPPVNLTASPAAILKGGSANLSWTTDGAVTVSIDNGIGAVSTSGSISVSPSATTTYTITATNGNGSASARTTVKVLGNPAPLPEGSFGKKYASLIPPDASVTQYDPKRFSVVTGLVKASDGAPIEGVSVTIQDHTAYGTATTDANGRFSLPLDGGATFTISYQKEGLLTAHRQVYVPWNDIAIAETVTMLTQDSTFTRILFDGNPATTMTHRSTPFTDDRGARSATMVFQGDNKAYLVDKAGNDVQELTTIRTRATEYVTPESMPAKLPPTSAYTYCAELQVDGAENQKIRFDKPVIFYVENFLGFNVGEIVPVGYYDRNQGVWVPSDNGKVVRLLDTDGNGIADAYDDVGDGQPHGTVTGLSDSAIYKPGATFWRVSLTHFTPVDCNWPSGPPSDATGPNPDQKPVADQQEAEDTKEECNPKDGQCIASLVEARSRILHEDIDIPGTDITLHYASNRVKGYKTIITVPASGATVPASLQKIIVRLKVAGRTFSQTLNPLPNQRAEFTWDGLDYLGQRVDVSTAEAAIGFEYGRIYWVPSQTQQAFGQAGVSTTMVPSRDPIVFWFDQTVNITQGANNNASGFGEGWTLSNNHTMDLSNPSVLFKGTGTINTNSSIIIDTIGGNGEYSFSGDGGPATGSQLYWPWAVAFDPAGNMYIVDAANHRIRKVDTNGIITTFAGNGRKGYGGDGGPAAQAILNSPYGLNLDAAGNLFIADCGNHRIRKVDTNGIITTVAGNGQAGYDGDVGIATQTRLRNPSGVAFDAAGNLFIADWGNGLVRKVDSAGIITRVVGNGIYGTSYDYSGMPAAQVSIDPYGLVFDKTGNLYISDNYYNRIAKVDINGVIWRYAGLGPRGYSGDGGPALQARMNRPTHIALDTLGNLCVGEQGNHLVRKVSTTGTISTVVGTGQYGYGGDGGPAVQAQLKNPRGVAFDSAGNLYVADVDNNRVRKVDAAGIISTVVGSGVVAYDGDGGTAVETQIAPPADIAVDASGNVYMADITNNRVRKIARTGKITTVAGTGETGFSGDGGPATQAKLNLPVSIAIDAQGNLFISDQYNFRIRKVDTSGVISTVAGTGEQAYTASMLADGGPAVQSRIGYCDAIAVDRSGNLFLGDWSNHRIRKVDTNGIISTIAGNGQSGYSGDGGPALQAKLYSPYDMAFDNIGNLFFSDTNNYRVRKIDPSGIITTVAGNGSSGYSGDNGPATQARFWQPMGIAVDTAGNIFIADYYNYAVRMVNKRGIITTLSGTGQFGSYAEGDGGAASKARLGYVRSVATDAAGNVYVGQEDVKRAGSIRKIAAAYDFTDGGLGAGYAFADEDGQGYVLDETGRHTSTIDLDTGITLEQFGYNAQGQLISITDAFDDKTVINRDANGTPISITSPDGITTYLTVDANGRLTGIRYADNTSYAFEYNNEGLLTAKTDPNHNTFQHVFDSTGRLTEVIDPEGGHWVYTRTTEADGDIVTTVTSGEGNTTTYVDQYLGSGAETHTVTNPAGNTENFTEGSDGLSGTRNYCGMQQVFKYDVDPQYKFEYLKESTTSSPANLKSITQIAKTYTDTNSDGKPDSITTSTTVNGKTTTTEENTLTSRITLTSPMGKTITTAYDPANLLTTGISVPGLLDTTYGYDTRGRLTSVTTGARTTTYIYNAEGFLRSVTDPRRFTTSYTYDVLGRVTGVSRPDGSTLGFAYDANGNRTILTNPSDIAHNFTYNTVNNPASYQTPLSGAYRYFYDTERNLTKTVLPSNKEITNTYDDARLIRITTPEKSINIGYACDTNVSSLSDGSNSIGYSYDGTLLTSTSLSGVLNQSLFFTYNNDFNLQSMSYAGGTATYTYDNDGLLSGINAFSIIRDARNGLPLSVSNGTMNTTNTFNGYGEVESRAVTVATEPVSSWSVTRDGSGRIATKTETINGVTSTYSYTYDPIGRLVSVTKDGTTVETYGYNLNGTRISESNTLRGVSRSLTYSDEDHLLTAGDTTYQYDVDGFLTSKQEGPSTTSYTYSTRGELLSVTLPNGNVVEYTYDPLGRRIATKVNGAVTEKYLWQGQTKLLAVYDGADNLFMRFEYANDRVPVSMAYEGATYYLSYDQIGSLKAVTDSSGTVVKRIDYDSFGNTLSDSNPAFFVPIGFAGGLLDTDTKLLHFGARDYDPTTGRWTAKDPIGFAGGDTDLYGYVLNDPVNLIDPSGELLPAPVMIAAAIVTIAAQVAELIAWAMHPAEPPPLHVEPAVPEPLNPNREKPQLNPEPPNRRVPRPARCR